MGQGPGGTVSDSVRRLCASLIDVFSPSHRDEEGALITTDQGQSAYIEVPAFAPRRIAELESLQTDPLEPFDP